MRVTRQLLLLSSSSSASRAALPGLLPGLPPAPQPDQLPAASEPPSPHALSEQRLFSQAPPFFVKVRGVGGEGETSLPPFPPPSRFPLYRVTSCRGAGPSPPTPPHPVPPPRLPSRPVRPPGVADGPAAAQQLQRLGRRHKLSLPVAVPARLPLGRGGRGARPARLPWQAAAARMYPTVADRRRAALRRAGVRRARTARARSSAPVCTCLVLGRGAPPAVPATPAAVLGWVFLGEMLGVCVCAFFFV